MSRGSNFSKEKKRLVAGGKIPSRRCYRRVGSLRLFRDNPGGIGPEARQLETNIRGIRREIWRGRPVRTATSGPYVSGVHKRPKLIARIPSSQRFRHKYGATIPERLARGNGGSENKLGGFPGTSLTFSRNVRIHQNRDAFVLWKISYRREKIWSRGWYWKEWRGRGVGKGEKAEEGKRKTGSTGKIWLAGALIAADRSIDRSRAVAVTQWKLAATKAASALRPTPLLRKISVSRLGGEKLDASFSRWGKSKAKQLDRGRGEGIRNEANRADANKQHLRKLWLRIQNRIDSRF